MFRRCTPLHGPPFKPAYPTGPVDCAELVLLYADAMEECLREAPDARFWFSILYWTAIGLGLSILGALSSCILR